MGRPSNFDRKDALTSVMHAMWRDGYEASSVKSLSEMLGITRSSFYNAFGTREALFEEVLSLYFSQTPDRLLISATPDMSVKNLLTSVCHAACKACAEDPEGRGCLAVNSISELCNTHETLGPIMEKIILDSLHRFETILGWGVKTGELDPALDPRITALAVQNLLIGINVMSKIVRSEKDLMSTVNTTLAALGLLNHGSFE